MKTKLEGDLNSAMADMADAFLRWPLPTSVRADLCATEQRAGRCGTNLMSYVEARQMMDEVVRPIVAKLLADTVVIAAPSNVELSHVPGTPTRRSP